MPRSYRAAREAAPGVARTKKRAGRPSPPLGDNEAADYELTCGREKSTFLIFGSELKGLSN